MDYKKYWRFFQKYRNAVLLLLDILVCVVLYYAPSIIGSIIGPLIGSLAGVFIGFQIREARRE
jgi:hypothetical protein